MLDKLRKKKMLATLKSGPSRGPASEVDKSMLKEFGADSIISRRDYAKKMVSQGASITDLHQLMGKGLTPGNINAADKPVYDELKKIPLNDQIKMKNERSGASEEDLEGDIRDNETDEEKKRRMLENLFLSKGQRNS
jgi:hypothetical protein